MTLNWNELWDDAEHRYRVKTRHGSEVRIFTLEARTDRPVVGERRFLNTWETTTWFLSGRYTLHGDSVHDLIPEPRTVRRWVNVYRRKSDGHIKIGGDGEMFNSQVDARDKHYHNPEWVRIATVPVEWEE